MYLSFSCSPGCSGDVEEESRQDDSHLFYGKFQGMTTAEDRFFGRSRSPEGGKGERVPIRKVKMGASGSGLVLSKGFEMKSGDEMMGFKGK